MHFYYITAVHGLGPLGLPDGPPALTIAHCESIGGLLAKLNEEMGDVPPAANLDEMRRRVNSWAEAARPGHVLRIGETDLIICGYAVIQSVLSRARYRVEDMTISPFDPSATLEDDDEYGNEYGNEDDAGDPDGDGAPPTNGQSWFPAEDAARPRRRPRPRREPH